LDNNEIKTSKNDHMSLQQQMTISCLETYDSKLRTLCRRRTMYLKNPQERHLRDLTEWRKSFTQLMRLNVWTDVTDKYVVMFWTHTQNLS